MKKKIKMQIFRPLIKDSAVLTWKLRMWWPLAVLALLVTGFIGYDLFLRGVLRLIQPAELLATWEVWVNGIKPVQFFTGQFNILLTDPKGWGAMILAWSIILAVLLLVFAISTFSVTTILSAIKMKDRMGKVRFMVAAVEGLRHLKPVLLSVLIFIVLWQVLLLVFSIPAIWLGVFYQSAISSILLVLVFALFLACAFIFTMMLIYSIMYIVMDNMTLSNSLPAAWKLLRRHWLLSIEMLIIQASLAFLTAFLLSILVSIIVIPVTWIGLILVQNQQFDITQYLPQGLWIFLSLMTLIFGAVYTMFQLFSWSFFFLKLDEAKPHLRFIYHVKDKLL